MSAFLVFCLFLVYAKLIAFQKSKKSDIISQVNPLIAAFYDSVLMYAWAFNKTLADGADPADGRVVARKLWNQTFFNGIHYFVNLEKLKLNHTNADLCFTPLTK